MTTSAPLVDAEFGPAAETKHAVRRLIQDHVQKEIDREKVYQYAEARRNELYYRGKQHLALFTTEGGLADYRPVTAGGLSVSFHSGSQVYDYVLNQFRGDIRKFVAVLGQRSPNVKGQPVVQGDEQHVRLARIADRAASFLRSVWSVDRAQRHLALALAKNGTTFLYTPWVADAFKYGSTSEPVYAESLRPAGEPYFECPFCGGETSTGAAEGGCAQCGQPLNPANYREPESLPYLETIGQNNYANGCCELHVATIFTVTTPFYIRSLDEAPWLWYEYEEHKGRLLRTYEELRRFRSEVGAFDVGYSAGYGRRARETAESASGIVTGERRDRWLYSRFWLHPDMYELIEGDESGRLREGVAETYPEGLKVTMVNGRVVRLEEERLTEVWAAVKPEASEYLYADPIFNDYIQIQDAVNDAWNIIIELMERGIPLTVFDPAVLDPERIKEWANLPGEFVPAKLGAGGDLSRAFFRAPSSSPPPEFYNIIEIMIEKAREITGVQRPIFGAQGRTKTAREAELLRNQALMQLNTTWNEMRDGWARAYENGARQLAKYAIAGRLYHPR